MARYKKIHITIILFLLCFFSMKAVVLTKEERKDFRKNVNHIGCTIDFSKTKVDGIALEKFIPYYAEKIQKSESYVRTFIESLPETVRLYPKELLTREDRVKVDYKNLGYTYFVEDPQKYNIVIIVNSFTTKGAYEAEVHFYRDNIEDYYSFTMKSGDRKWNSDEVLIREGMAELGARTANRIYRWGRDFFPKELKAKE